MSYVHNGHRTTKSSLKMLEFIQSARASRQAYADEQKACALNLIAFAQQPSICKLLLGAKERLTKSLSIEESKPFEDAYSALHKSDARLFGKNYDGLPVAETLVADAILQQIELQEKELKKNRIPADLIIRPSWG